MVSALCEKKTCACHVYAFVSVVARCSDGSVSCDHDVIVCNNFVSYIVRGARAKNELSTMPLIGTLVVPRESLDFARGGDH